jgi:hypothetical protein
MFYDVNDGWLTEDQLDEYAAYEKVILEEAEKNGIFDNLNEDETYTTYNEASYSGLNGGRGKSVMVMNKASKTKWLKTRFSEAIAKANNDPLQKKLAKINKTRLKLISKINQKYNAASTKAAKAAIRSASKVGSASNLLSGKSTSSKASSIKQSGNTSVNATKKTKNNK